MPNETQHAHEAIEAVNRLRRQALVDLQKEIRHVITHAQARPFTRPRGRLSMCSHCDWNYQPENEPPDETQLHDRDPEYEAWAEEVARQDTLRALDDAIDEGHRDLLEYATATDPMQTLLEQAYISRYHTHHCDGPCHRKYLACLKVPCEYRPFDVDERRRRWMCADCRDAAGIVERRVP
jgi:hypothetical protein